MEENTAKLREAAPEEEEIPQEILTLVEQRTEAKKNRDFKTADEIRDRLKAMGITLIDTKEGVKIQKE